MTLHFRRFSRSAISPLPATTTALRVKSRATKRPVVEERQSRRFRPIADHYRLAIIERRLKPGDKLPSERVISEEFGVARSSVREALFTLSRLGFVSISEGARARVTEPDPRIIFRELGGVAAMMLHSADGVRELQLVRHVIETGLARQAAISASDTAIGDIEAALRANQVAIKGKAAAFVRTDVMFHRAIAVAVGNSLMLSLLDGLTEWLTEQRTVRVEAQGAVFDAHRRIFEAIAARDPGGAHAAMDDHLMEVVKSYWGT